MKFAGENTKKIFCVILFTPQMKYCKGGIVIFKNDHGINDMITGGRGVLDFFDHEIKVRPLRHAPTPDFTFVISVGTPSSRFNGVFYF